jgi:hypothetical protein
LLRVGLHFQHNLPVIGGQYARQAQAGECVTESNGPREAERLERAVESYLKTIEQVPPELLDRLPKEGEWSIHELTAHSAEIFHYWAQQVAQVKQHPGEPFGRTMADPARIAFVADHKQDALLELMSLMKQGAAEAAAVFRSFSDEEWRTVTGLHSARGEMDMDLISNLFVAGHAEEHLKQLEETLAAVRAQRR